MYENYAKIRDAMGLSDFEVAKRAGVSRGIFTRWKNGQTTPTKTTRFKICNVLGIPPTLTFAGKQDDEFVIDGTPTVQEAARIRMAEYVIRLSNGRAVKLSVDQYNELKTSVDAFIDAWVYTHIKE